KGESNFQRRFPGHVRTGYVVLKDSIAVVLLNSNFQKLSAQDIATQDAWYMRTLAELDQANDVRAVIVCCHHSPFSNSRLVGSSPAVQRHFVPPFLNTTKACVLISGH